MSLSFPFSEMRKLRGVQVTVVVLQRTARKMYKVLQRTWLVIALLIKYFVLPTFCCHRRAKISAVVAQRLIRTPSAQIKFKESKSVFVSSYV